MRNCRPIFLPVSISFFMGKKVIISRKRNSTDHSVQSSVFCGRCVTCHRVAEHVMFLHYKPYSVPGRLLKQTTENGSHVPLATVINKQNTTTT